MNSIFKTAKNFTMPLIKLGLMASLLGFSKSADAQNVSKKVKDKTHPVKTTQYRAPRVKPQKTVVPMTTDTMNVYKGFGLEIGGDFTSLLHKDNIRQARQGYHVEASLFRQDKKKKAHLNELRFFVGMKFLSGEILGKDLSRADNDQTLVEWNKAAYIGIENKMGLNKKDNLLFSYKALLGSTFGTKLYTTPSEYQKLSGAFFQIEPSVQYRPMKNLAVHAGFSLTLADAVGKSDIHGYERDGTGFSIGSNIGINLLLNNGKKSRQLYKRPVLDTMAKMIDFAKFDKLNDSTKLKYPKTIYRMVSSPLEISLGTDYAPGFMSQMNQGQLAHKFELAYTPGSTKNRLNSALPQFTLSAEKFTGKIQGSPFMSPPPGGYPYAYLDNGGKMDPGTLRIEEAYKLGAQITWPNGHLQNGRSTPYNYTVGVRGGLAYGLVNISDYTQPQKQHGGVGEIFFQASRMITNNLNVHLGFEAGFASMSDKFGREAIAGRSDADNSTFAIGRFGVSLIVGHDKTYKKQKAALQKARL